MYPLEEVPLQAGNLCSTIPPWHFLVNPQKTKKLLYYHQLNIFSVRHQILPRSLPPSSLLPILPMWSLSSSLARSLSYWKCSVGYSQAMPRLPLLLSCAPKSTIPSPENGAPPFAYICHFIFFRLFILHLPLWRQRGNCANGGQVKVGELWREHLNLGLILPLHGPFHILRKISFNMRHMNKILKCLTLWMALML